MYVGPFMTSLDMAGFSLTLMRVDDALLKALDAPTQVNVPERTGFQGLVPSPRP